MSAGRSRPPYSRGYTLGARIFCAVYLACVFVPLAITAVWAFTDSWPWPDLIPSGLSTRGIAEIFAGHAPIGRVLVASVLIAIGVSALTVLTATLASHAFVHYRFFGRDMFHFLAILPYILPATVFAMGIQVAFLKVGLGRTVVGVIVAHTIVALPYAMAIMVDVMRAAGTKLQEQSKVLGASWWQTLVHVTLPALLPGILSAATMAYIISFSTYFLTLLIGGGSVKTLAVVMLPFMRSGDRTIASAYTLVFLLSTLGVFFIFEWALKKLGLRETRSFFV